MSKIEIPLMKSCPSYDHWKKMIRKWSKVTKIDKTNQADTIILTLPVEAQNLALEIDDAALEHADGTGVETLLKKLDEIYDKNTNQKIFSAYEEFESFQRSPSMGIAKFIG